MVQYEDANRAEVQWERDGSPACTHSYEKEYYLGTDSGDFRCVHCGATLTRSEMKARQRGEEIEP